MSDPLRIAGPRELRARLDRPEAGTDRAVVACPPHPERGGDRRDQRLRAVSDALADRGIACLRFDYGPWDGGDAERDDARAALARGRAAFDRVGLFGYSFGGGVAILAAAAESASAHPPAAVSVLSPVSTLADAAVALAVDDLDCPLQVVYGEDDETVDSGPVTQRARAAGHTVASVPGGHFLVEERARAADLVASFLADRL